jgi:hypothetical protein
MVLDAIINDRDYEFFEHELVSDWRVHYRKSCSKLKETALQALRRVPRRNDADAGAAQAGAAQADAELETLIKRLAEV